MAKDGKIMQVKVLLQSAPHSYKDLISKTGITKATAYSLKYYFTQQGYGIVDGINDAKEVTLHIVSVPEPKVAKVAEPVIATAPVAVPVVGTVTGRLKASEPNESAKPRSAAPRKVVAKALAGKAAKTSTIK